MQRTTNKQLLFIIIVTTLIFVLMGVMDVGAEESTVCPNLDGNPAKWQTMDVFKLMYEAGEPDKDHVADLYILECGGFLNFAVILRDGFEIDPNADMDNHWIRVKDKKVFDGTSPTFEWLIGVEGWEGKIPVVDGWIDAHTQYGNDQTAETVEAPPTSIFLTTVSASAISEKVELWLVMGIILGVIFITVSVVWMRSNRRF